MASTLPLKENIQLQKHRDSLTLSNTKMAGSWNSKHTKVNQIAIHGSGSLEFPPQSINPDIEIRRAEEINHGIIEESNCRSNSTLSEQVSEIGEPFGVILSRSCSITSASSLSLRTEKQISALEKVVKRAFSLTRPPSVPDEQNGIFHQFSPENKSKVKARRNKIKRGNLLKACKRLLGF